MSVEPQRPLGRMRRRAEYLARFLSWKSGRPVTAPPYRDGFAGSSWEQEPLRFADTGEPYSEQSG